MSIESLAPQSLTTYATSDAVRRELIDTSSGFTYAVPGKDVWTDIGTLLDFGWDGKRHVCLEMRYRGNVTSVGFPCRSGSIARIWANSTTADNYVATSGSTGTSGGLKVRLTVDPNNVLLAPDTASIGTTVGVVLVNAPAGAFYQFAASLGQAPLSLGKYTIGLTFDTVFLTSVLVGPPVFNAYGGQVPASGAATAKLSVPAIPALVGICVHHAAVVFDKTGILGCTNTGGSMLSK